MEGQTRRKEAMHLLDAAGRGHRQLVVGSLPAEHLFSGIVTVARAGNRPLPKTVAAQIGGCIVGAASCARPAAQNGPLSREPRTDKCFRFSHGRDNVWLELVAIVGGLSASDG